MEEGEAQEEGESYIGSRSRETVTELEIHTVAGVLMECPGQGLHSALVWSLSGLLKKMPGGYCFISPPNVYMSSTGLVPGSIGGYTARWCQRAV